MEQSKRPKKPSGAQFRKRRKEEEEKRVKDEGMQISISDASDVRLLAIYYPLANIAICCY